MKKFANNTIVFFVALVFTISLTFVIVVLEDLVPVVIVGSIFVCCIAGLFAYFIGGNLLKSDKLPLLLLMLIPTIYYGSGLLPLSSRRDYFDPLFWYSSLIVMNLSMLVGWGMAGLLPAPRASVGDGRNFSVLLRIAYFIYGAGLCAAALVVVQYGFVLLNPNIRFLISSYYLYIIELMVLAVIIMFASKHQMKSLTFGFSVVVLVAALLGLSSSGYRSQMVLLLVGLLLYFTFCQNLEPDISRSKLFQKSVGWGVFIIFAILSIGYYLRVEFSGGGILGWDQRVAELEISNSNILLPFLPIHESARENIGVATTALNRLPEILGFGSLSSFIWIELLTMLPGYSETATGILGQVVNRSQSDFLTPGVIGGLQISYGYFGLIVYFCGVAAVVRMLWQRAMYLRDRAYYAVLAIFFVYYIHFMYRGIVRPMYLIVFVLLLVLMFFTKYSKNGKYSENI